MPALELKGKSEPVDAWRLLDVEPDAAGVARRLDTPLVGRSAELDALLAELERVLADRACRIVTIVGEPGVGKSRLAAELVATVGTDALVLEGRCLPYGNGITYWPLVEVVRDLDLEADPRQRARRRDGARAHPRGRSAAPSRARAPTSSTAAIRRLLETLARERPVVLVLDDIQWAEPAFLDLVEYLAGWSRDAPILVCCLARPDLADVRPGWGGTTIQLAPLPREHVRTLLENLAGPLDPEAADAVGRATGGNPLFLEEMLRMLVEDGVLVEREGRLEPLAAVESMRVPETVQAVLAARLDRLGEDELAVLQRAAVIGQVFWWGAMADLSPPEEVGEVAGRLQALVRKGLIKPDARTFAGEDGFRFGHILIRDAAYDSMPKRLRAELHERFAGWAEDHAGEGAELDEIIGHHLEQAYGFRIELGPRGEEEDRLAGRAADRLLRAGRRALARRGLRRAEDIHAARTLLERAAALLAPGDVRRLDLAPELGLVLTASGALSRAEEVLTEVIERTRRRPAVRRARGADRARRAAAPQRSARRLGGGPRAHRGGAAWARGCGRSRSPGTPSDRARLVPDRPCPRALGRARPGRGGGAAPCAAPRAGGGRSLAGGGDRRPDRLRGLVRAAARCTTASGSASRCSSPRRTTSSWRPAVVAGSAASSRGRAGSTEARELVAAAAAAYEELGARLDAVSTAAFGRADVELLAGDDAAAESALREGYEALGNLGEIGTRASVAAMLARTLHARGHAEEADGLAREVEATASEQDLWSQTLYRLTRARLLVDAGALDEAERVARDALAIVEPTDLLDLRGDVLLELADVLRSGGRADEARDCIQTGITLYEAKGNVVAVERARAQLELGGYEGVRPMRAAIAASTGLLGSGGT